MSSRYRKRDAGLKLGDYSRTLGEVARELGISPERVRQLENRALAKARAILERHGYRLEDLLEVDHE